MLVWERRGVGPGSGGNPTRRLYFGEHRRYYCYYVSWVVATCFLSWSRGLRVVRTA